MKKIQGLTERGYKVIGTEYDRSPNGQYIWIQNDYDIYVCLASTVEEVEIQEVKTIQSNKGYSAKIEIFTNNETDRFQTTDNDRSLEIWVTVKGKEQNKVDEILDSIRDIMENELQIDGFKFDYCPNSDEINGKFESNDGMTIEYKHGDMKEIKDDIKEAFKTAKKQLGIR